MKNFLYPVLLLAGLFFTQIELTASGHSKSALPNDRMDVTPPEFTDCPAGLVTLCTYISSTQNPVRFLATWPIPSATDDSGGFVTIVQTAGPISGVSTFLTLGVTYMVTYKATDPSGNITYCSFFVRLDDDPPVWTYCPGNLTVCSPTEPWPLPTATDDCGQVAIVQVAGPISGVTALTPGIIYTVGYKATDLMGNSATCYFTVSIDNTPPMAACSNQTLTFNGQNSIPLNANTLVTSTDDCGIQSIALSPSAINCAQLGQIVPVTATVTDINGNTATCTSNITVAGLPCGWSQNPNGVNCPNGSNVGFNRGTGLWTITSTNCFYGPGFTSDATAFAQRSLCGNGSITAQVTSINGAGWAGVMMRESTAPGAKKAQLLTNLSSLHRREFRTVTNGQAFPQQFQSNGRYWLRIVRTGNQFSMYTSPNGTSWFFVGSQNIVMQSCIQVGLVVTNYTANGTVTATFFNVGFTQDNPLSGQAADVQPVLGQVEFAVFPNPTSGELNLDLTQYAGKPVRIELYSLEGKLMKFVEIDEVQTIVEQLDLSSIQRGMYLVRVKSEGLPDATRRVVLNR